MGRIVLHDGRASRTVPVEELDGVVEIDVPAGRITVPEGLDVDYASKVD